MNEYIDQIKAFYGGLTGSQRIALVGAVLASLIAIGVVTWWSGQESYSAVYTGNPAEMSRVTQALDTAGVSYRIAASGTTIEVPTTQKGAGLVAVAGAGVGGWQEIFGSIDMGTSPSMEREYRTRALEAELQKTLSSLSEITGSRVHIVPPENTSLLLADKRASASVTIQTGGTTLTKQQIMGVVRLVAGAVNGLDVQHVSLIDEDGRLLYPEAGADAGMQSLSDLAELSGERRRDFVADIHSIAERVLGSRDAITASVGVELVTATTQQQDMILNPELQAVESEEIREDRSSEPGGAMGQPGTGSNLPEQAPAAAGGAESESSQIRTNYVTSTSNKTILIPPGDIKRISAAVAVDLKKVQAVVAEGLVSEDQLRKELQRSIEAVLGYDSARGDVVSVSFLPFAEAPAAEVEEASFSTLTYTLEGYMPSLVALVAVVLFFLVVARPIVGLVAKSRPAPREDSDEKDKSEIEAQIESMTDPSLLMRKIRQNIDNFEAVDARDLNRLAQMHEDPAAAVLRRWLKAS